MQTQYTAVNRRAPARSAIAIHRVQDGRLVEHWANKDELGLIVQLGVVEMPQAPVASPQGSVESRQARP